jgi:hypothetical protein
VSEKRWEVDTPIPGEVYVAIQLLRDGKTFAAAARELKANYRMLLKQVKQTLPLEEYERLLTRRGKRYQSPRPVKANNKRPEQVEERKTV